MCTRILAMARYASKSNQTIVKDGVILPPDEYEWLGHPALVDVLLSGNDLLVTPGSTSVVRAYIKAQILVYYRSTYKFAYSGTFPVTRDSFSGRLFLRVVGCAREYTEGFVSPFNEGRRLRVSFLQRSQRNRVAW